MYRRLAWVGAAAVVVLGGIGAGGWLLLGHHEPRSPGASQTAGVRLAGQGGPATATASAGGPQATMSATAGTAAPAASPAVTTPPVSTPPVTPPSVDAVAMTAVAAASPAGSQAAAFLWHYFDAINRHDYAAYEALLAPPMQGMSHAQFDSGYSSTTDSAETLQSVSAASNGDYVAVVTFTSHQDPAQSATGTNCTKWDIALYLAPNGASFLIDKPPSSYHAGYTRC